MEVRIGHALEPAEVRRRLEQLAGRHGVTLSYAGDLSGEIIKKTFVGTVRARYRIEDVHLRVELMQRPAGIPEGTLRRLLEDELGRALE